MSTETKILGIAFGNWKSDSTYSGVPKHLLGALDKKGNLVDCLNAKRLNLSDFFEGAVDFKKIAKYGRPGINDSWLWRAAAIEKLSERIQRDLIRRQPFQVALQMGTHVRVKINDVKHYCRTDMTVAQAIQANAFGLGALDEAFHAEAIASQKSIFDTCDGIFVTSNWVKNSVCSDYDLPPTRVHVIGAGASLPAMATRGHNVHHRDPLRPNILFVGRDWYRKGGQLLLQAFEVVKQRFPKCTLTVIGCKPRIEDKNVHVLGPLNKKRTADLQRILTAYTNATVLCVPSLFEPFGMIWLEAQLYGVVPVTFLGQGRAEAIRDGETGILVKERDSISLAEALLEILSDKTRLHAMSIAAREFALGNFTWDRVAEKIISIIDGDLAQNVR